MKLPTDVKTERRQKTWRFSDLFTDSTTGRMRESMIWSMAAKGSILWAYIKFVSALNFETMTFVMAAALLGHELGARFMNQRQQQIEKQP